jgi:hypothetical protein
MNERTRGITSTGKTLATEGGKDYLVLMDTMNLDTGQSATPETEIERQIRLAREADGIARARASIAAGYYATSAEVNAWIDSLGTNNPLPVPYPNHPRPR